MVSQCLAYATPTREGERTYLQSLTWNHLSTSIRRRSGARRSYASGRAGRAGRSAAVVSIGKLFSLFPRWYGLNRTHSRLTFTHPHCHQLRSTRTLHPHISPRPMRHLRLPKSAANVSHPYGGHAANDMSCGPLILASERPSGSGSGSGSGTPGLET